MAVRDRVVGLLEERLGVTLMTSGEASQLRESVTALHELRDMAEDVAWTALTTEAGRKQDMRLESRVRIAQRSRTAFMEDPLEGTASDHYANFSLGAGVGRPQAADREVQRVIDEAWEDSVNIDALVGYEALRALSNELRAGCNVFLLGFPENGKIRVSFLEADTVRSIVSEDGNRFRPLWYIATESRGGWDFKNHRPKIPDVSEALKPRYYAHWRNVDQVREERRKLGKAAQEEPGAEFLGKGVVFHARINRLLEQQFGTPLGRRTLRFQAALNKMIEARVNMQLAASAFIAKRVVRGTGSDVSKAAEALIQQTGLIGTSSTAAARQGLLGLQAPVPPGSINVENESDTLQPLTLNSGSAAANVDAMMVRGAAVAPSGMGQHYFGASDATNLASAACHDEQTETLTDEGWMTYEQLRERDATGTLPRIAGFNVQTGHLEYHYPQQRMLQYDYDGKMVRFRNARSDILVTPEHRMWVGRGDRWEFREAQELLRPGQQGGVQRWDQLKAVAPLEAPRQEVFVLPEADRWNRRKGPRTPVTETERATVLASRPRSRPLVVEGEGGCGCGGSVERISNRNRYGQDGSLLVGKGHPQRFLPSHSFRSFRTAEEIRDLTGLPLYKINQVVKAPRRRGHKDVSYPPVEIPMDDFLYWLGWFIAEGSGGGEVAQSERSVWLQGLQDACRGLGIPGRESWKGDGSKPGGRMWHWRPTGNPGQWKTWLDQNVGVGARNKRVPDFVFTLSAEQQFLVLRGLMQGDGSCGTDDTWERCGSSYFGSSSPLLADHVQRLALNCGYRARRTGLGGVSIIATAERSPSLRWRGHISRLPVPERVPYRGKVYCFTLPTSTMVTRRNGQVAFHGQTMELPALMAVGAFQKTIEQILRWFTDLAIQEAVRSGRLGGATRKEPGDKALQELILEEAEDRAAAERRTGKDLSYTLQMPYPGRRNLPDVVAAVTGVLTQLSPIGENPDLLEICLEFLFTHGFQLEDPSGEAKRVAETQGKLLRDQAERQAEQQQLQLDAQAQADTLGSNGGPPGRGPVTPPGESDTQQSRYGEKRKTAQPRSDGTVAEGDLVEQPLPEELERMANVLVAHARRVLEDGVRVPALEAAAALNGRGSS